mmetsp:Transcript_160145/g.292426  ORF Transcript_160145/g.292426 Transcript_160145/m.292426 type:complete len:155 (-) Transcript_160145:35-499(-)
MNFCYIRDHLAGMRYPATKESIDFLKAEGMTMVVSLHRNEDELPANLAAHGIDWLHIRVPDFEAPSQDQLDEFVARVKTVQASGGKAVVHCKAGQGRTGTFLAAWVSAEGKSADEAIAEVRKKRPGSIETLSQEEAVEEFARRCKADKELSKLK